jgi:hypothetical protein
MKVHPKAVITFFIFFDLMRIAAAQTDSKPFIQPEISNSDIAKKLANPISNVVTVPFEWNYDRGTGTNQSGSDQTLLFQPVIPFDAGGGDTIIARPIVTAERLNNVNGYTGAGLSNIQLETFYVPYSSSSWFWGIGPYLSSPAGSSGQFGSRQTGVGVNAVIVNQIGAWTYGVMAFQSWSMGGTATSGTANNFYAQPFIAYVTPDAWTFSLNTQSNYNYDVRRASNPVNFDISKLLQIDKLPIQFTIGPRYNVSSIPGWPQGWGARAVITFVFLK